MNFVIRDDDLNYFTKPSDIRNWYEDIFSSGIPVGFSTVPFVKTVSDIYPRNIDKENKEYPISQNNDLIDYVKNNPLIEVMQHGCTHEAKNGVFEYEKKQGLEKDTKRGKEELKRAFGKEIKIFVPPHDRISNHGIRIIEKSEMDIIRGKGSKNFLLRKEYLNVIFKMTLHRVSHPYSMPAYPYVLNMGLHKEAFSFRLRDDNLKELKKGLDYINEKNGNFIIACHLHHFNETRKRNLRELINLAKSLRAKFTFPKELFL